MALTIPYGIRYKAVNWGDAEGTTSSQPIRTLGVPLKEKPWTEQAKQLRRINKISFKRNRLHPYGKSNACNPEAAGGHPLVEINTETTVESFRKNQRCTAKWYQ